MAKARDGAKDREGKGKDWGYVSDSIAEWRDIQIRIAQTLARHSQANVALAGMCPNPKGNWKGRTGATGCKRRKMNSWIRECGAFMCWTGGTRHEEPAPTQQWAARRNIRGAGSEEQGWKKMQLEMNFCPLGNGGSDGTG
jgi:hypothetical protein